MNSKPCSDLPPPSPLLTKEGEGFGIYHDSFFLFLNKPEGLSSQQCLTWFKKKYGAPRASPWYLRYASRGAESAHGQGFCTLLADGFRKIGHHGTLDPFATGLLLVGVNEATKFFPFIDDSFKTYRATLKLGQATDTLDRTGRVIEERGVPALSQSDLQTVASRFVGSREHEPPMYSAVKVGGQKLYALARKGKEVERKPRQIEVKEFSITESRGHEIDINLTVSRGTYVRVLADEYARALGTVGHLIELQRTVLCGHQLNEAFTIESKEEISDKKISIEAMLRHLPSIVFDEKQKRELCFGKTIPVADIQNGENILNTSDKTFFAAFSATSFLGIVVRKDNHIQPFRLIRTDIDL